MHRSTAPCISIGLLRKVRLNEGGMASGISSRVEDPGPMSVFGEEPADRFFGVREDMGFSCLDLISSTPAPMRSSAEPDAHPLDGRTLAVQTVYNRRHRLLERAGVPIVRPHDARHTTATLMLGQGVHPKLVSEMLGHATVAITLDLYSHATPAMHREAASTLDALLRKAPG
jgi:hypothetical protein